MKSFRRPVCRQDRDRGGGRAGDLHGGAHAAADAPGGDLRQLHDAAHHREELPRSLLLRQELQQTGAQVSAGLFLSLVCDNLFTVLTLLHAIPTSSS